MGTLLDDLAFIHNTDLVGVTDGRKTMGDDDSCTLVPLHQTVEGSLDHSFAFSVESTCRFVQQEDSRVLQDGSGDRNSLFLTPRQLTSSVADIGVVLVRELFNEVVGVGALGCGLNLFPCGSLFASADVLGDGSAEENRFLPNEANLVAKPLDIQPAQIFAVQTNSSGVRIVETFNQLDGSTLTASTSADQSHGFARLDSQGVAISNFVIRAAGIRKLDVLKLEFTLNGISQGFFASIIRIANFGFTVDNSKDGVQSFCSFFCINSVTLGLAETSSQHEHAKDWDKHLIKSCFPITDLSATIPVQQGKSSEQGKLGVTTKKTTHDGLWQCFLQYFVSHVRKFVGHLFLKRERGNCADAANNLPSNSARFFTKSTVRSRPP